MHGSSVIFATELTGNFGKAKLQLLVQHIHGDLAGHHNVFVAFWPDDIFEWDLEVPGGAFNDLFGAKVLGPVLGDLQQAGGNSGGRCQATHLTPGQ